MEKISIKILKDGKEVEKLINKDDCYTWFVVDGKPQLIKPNDDVLFQTLYGSYNELFEQGDM